MRTKFDSYIGFAKKSGNLVSGAGTCELAAGKGKLKLLIVATDSAEGTKKKMRNMATAKGVQYREYGLADTLSKLTGTKGKNVFGITEKNFANIISKEIDDEISRKEEL